MDCTICGGKIKRQVPDRLKGDYGPSKIYCLSCGKQYTWKEYQAMRCDKLVEMMRGEK